MYVTSNEDVIYLKTKDITYGISPQNGKNLKNSKGKGDKNSGWEYSTNKILIYTRIKGTLFHL